MSKKRFKLPKLGFVSRYPDCRTGKLALTWEKSGDVYDPLDLIQKL